MFWSPLFFTTSYDLIKSCAHIYIYMVKSIKERNKNEANLKPPNRNKEFITKTSKKQRRKECIQPNLESRFVVKVAVKAKNIHPKLKAGEEQE